MNKKIVLAGGCFWGLEELFRELPGVIDTDAGYTGGENENPTYKNHPGHAEAIEVIYNEEKISLLQLIDFFFRVHNPTTLNRQGNDTGTSYRSAIFYNEDSEKAVAEEMIKIVNESKAWGTSVVTQLEKLKSFHIAEEYHQDYLQKHPNGYTCHAIRFKSFLK